MAAPSSAARNPLLVHSSEYFIQSPAPPRGFGSLEPSSRQRFTHLIAELTLISNKSAASRRDDPAQQIRESPISAHPTRPERRLRPLSSLRHLCRSHPARGEAGRTPGAVPDQVRDGREPQDGLGSPHTIPYGQE